MLPVNEKSDVNFEMSVTVLGVEKTNPPVTPMDDVLSWLIYPMPVERFRPCMDDAYNWLIYPTPVERFRPCMDDVLSWLIYPTPVERFVPCMDDV